MMTLSQEEKGLPRGFQRRSIADNGSKAVVQATHVISPLSMPVDGKS